MNTQEPNTPAINPACRAHYTRRWSTNDFAECLTNDPACLHRLKGADYCLCFHPFRVQIIAQSNRINP